MRTDGGKQGQLVRRRARRGRPAQRGFTLIELVITIVLVGVLAGLAAYVILQGVTAYTREESRSDMQYLTKLALDRIARESRQIRGCADISGPANPSGTLSFTDIGGNTAAFSVSGTDLLRGTDLLASGVTSAQPFRFLASDGATATTACPGIWFIEISLSTARAGETISMRTRVHPRNF